MCDNNRLNVKNSFIISIVGVSLTICGICGLFLLAIFSRHVFKRADFSSINGNNIFLILLVSVIFLGFVVELVGRYRLGKTLNDMRLLYHKLNSYFALSLLVSFAVKDLLDRNEYFLFVKFDVSPTSFDGPGGAFSYMIFINLIFSTSVIILYCLFKDFRVLSKTFDTHFPMIVLIVLIPLCLPAFIMPAGISIFIPYLVMQIVMYIRLFNANPIEKLNQSKGKILDKIEKICLVIVALIIIIIFIKWLHIVRIADMRLLLFIILTTPLLSVAIVFFVISLLQKYNQTILSLIAMILLSATVCYFILLWRPS